MNMEKTYWNDNGKYKKEYDELWNYVPDIGYTGDKYIDALIAMSKMYHDIYNNGLGNEDILFDNFYTHMTEIESELDIDNNVLQNVVRKRTYIDLVDVPVYVYDEENDYETDEIDYYDKEDKYCMEDITDNDYADYELVMDAVIELAWENRQKCNIA